MRIKIKKEIEKNKIETQKELLEIRSGINNNLLQNSSVIYNCMNMPDKAVKDMEIEYNNKEKNDEDIDVDEESILCFKIRQKVEILLKQIAQKNNIYLMKYSIIQLLKLLNSKEIIPNKLYNVLIEILIICNKAIHGESISENHSEFIKNTYAKVLQELEKINNV